MQNSRRGQIFGLQRMGTKNIPEHVRSHRQTELERAKASLLIATLPKSPPCRKKYDISLPSSWCIRFSLLTLQFLCVLILQRNGRDNVICKKCSLWEWMPWTLPICSWCSWNWQSNFCTYLINSVLLFRIFVFFIVIGRLLLKLQTMSVLTVMRKLHSEVNAGNLKPYCFVEINGLKLASPEGIYKVNNCKYPLLRLEESIYANFKDVFRSYMKH